MIEIPLPTIPSVWDIWLQRQYKKYEHDVDRLTQGAIRDKQIQIAKNYYKTWSGLVPGSEMLKMWKEYVDSSK